MSDKQQLASMGAEMAEKQQQPMCMAKRIEEMEAQVRVMAESLREAVSVLSSINHGGEHEVNIEGDEPAFWQRGEWVDWAKSEVLPKLQAALASKMPDAWLPIETAPRDRRKVLVYRPLAENSGDEPIAVKRLTGGRNNSCWDGTVPPGETPCNPTDGACHVTHWMPLPDAPSPDGAK